MCARVIFLDTVKPQALYLEAGEAGVSLGSDDAHLAWIASGSLGSWWAWGSLGALFSSRSCHSGGSLGSRLAGGRRLSGHAGLAALSCGALDALCPWGASRAFGTLGGGGSLFLGPQPHVHLRAGRTKQLTGKLNEE